MDRYAEINKKLDFIITKIDQIVQTIEECLLNDQDTLATDLSDQNLTDDSEQSEDEKSFVKRSKFA